MFDFDVKDCCALSVQTEKEFYKLNRPASQIISTIKYLHIWCSKVVYKSMSNCSLNEINNAGI